MAATRAIQICGTVPELSPVVWTSLLSQKSKLLCTNAAGQAANNLDLSAYVIGADCSIRQTGPPPYSGPSDSTKTGASLFMNHTCMSGGCLPTNGATFPAIPAISK